MSSCVHSSVVTSPGLLPHRTADEVPVVTLINLLIRMPKWLIPNQTSYNQNVQQHSVQYLFIIIYVHEDLDSFPALSKLRMYLWRSGSLVARRPHHPTASYDIFVSWLFLCLTSFFFFLFLSLFSWINSIVFDVEICSCFRKKYY